MKGGRRIPPELLERIKQSVSLVDVVSEHVTLRKSGANYTGLCPFHSERSPSFSVSEQKQLFHCYGCQKGGDIVTFVKDLHSLSFSEAIEDLAVRGKVQLPKEWELGLDGEKDPEAAARKKAALEKQSTANRLNLFAARFYQESLKRTSHLSQYFRMRGISDPELHRSFLLGGAEPSWDSLSRRLVTGKAPLELAVELGLIKPSQKGQGRDGPGYFDLFRNRAMFPILDTRGKVVGFGGRAQPTPPGAMDVGGESPKYLNSSESFVFHKSKLAYGIFQAQKHIREADEVILVEGYFDVLALHAAGFQNVVATCGTALTPDHLILFKRLASKVVVLFDGDKAGLSATGRAMEVGLDHGQVLYGASMPPGLDPDEVLFDDLTGNPRAGGVEKMREILKAAQPLLDSRIQDSAREALQGGSEALTQSVKQVAAWLARFKDPVGREVRLNRASEQLGVGRDLLERAMGAPVRSGQPAVQIQTSAARGSSASRTASGSAGSVGSGGQSHSSPQRPPQSGGGGYDEPPPWVTASNAGEGQFGGGQFSGQFGGQFRGGGSGYGGGYQGGRKQGDGKGRGGRWGRDDRAAPTGAPTPKRAANRVAGRDIGLLQGLLLYGPHCEILESIRPQLPNGMTPAELFEGPALRHWVVPLLEEAGEWQILRGDPQSYLKEGIPAQLRSIVTEALGATEEQIPEADFRQACRLGLASAWARFSQQIKIAMADAESKQDAGLQAKLMQEYLDVKRKMKEFSVSYDEG